MEGEVLEVSKPVKAADNITGYIAFFTLIGTVVLNSTLLFSQQYLGFRRLTDTLIMLTTSNLLSAMIYSGIIVMTELKGQATVGRYLQWLITIPLIIMAIIYYADYLNNETGSSKLTYAKVLPFLIVGFLMVVFSCLSEFIPAQRITFLLITLLLYIVAMALFAAGFYTSRSCAFFWIVVVAFGLYGVVHIFNPKYREFCFNILDTITRVGFSLLIDFTLLSKDVKANV